MPNAYKFTTTQHTVGEEFQAPTVESGDGWEYVDVSSDFFTEKGVGQNRDFVVVVVTWRKKI